MNGSTAKAHPIRPIPEDLSHDPLWMVGPHIHKSPQPLHLRHQSIFRNTHSLFKDRERWLFFLREKPLRYVSAVCTNSENAIASPELFSPFSPVSGQGQGTIVVAFRRVERFAEVQRPQCCARLSHISRGKSAIGPCARRPRAASTPPLRGQKTGVCNLLILWCREGGEPHGIASDGF